MEIKSFGDVNLFDPEYMVDPREVVRTLIQGWLDKRPPGAKFMVIEYYMTDSDIAIEDKDPAEILRSTYRKWTQYFSPVFAPSKGEIKKIMRTWGTSDAAQRGWVLHAPGSNVFDLTKNDLTADINQAVRDMVDDRLAEAIHDLRRQHHATLQGRAMGDSINHFIAQNKAYNARNSGR